MPLFVNLDSTPIHFIPWIGFHRHGLERPVEYQPLRDLETLTLRQLLQKKGILTVEKRLFHLPDKRSEYVRTFSRTIFIK